jgi:hypothetical protein
MLRWWREGFLSYRDRIHPTKDISPFSRFVRIRYSRFTPKIAKLCKILKPIYQCFYTSTVHEGADDIIFCRGWVLFVVVRRVRVRSVTVSVVVNLILSWLIRSYRSIGIWFQRFSNPYFEFLSVFIDRVPISLFVAF